MKSQFGYHVILVTHATFASVQGALAQGLQQDPLLARNLRIEEMHVWINPQFGTGVLSTDPQSGQPFYRITPPAAPSVRVCREKAYPCSTTTIAPSTTVPAGG